MDGVADVALGSGAWSFCTLTDPRWKEPGTWKLGGAILPGAALSRNFLFPVVGEEMRNNRRPRWECGGARQLKLPAGPRARSSRQQGKQMGQVKLRSTTR